MAHNDDIFKSTQHTSLYKLYKSDSTKRICKNIQVNVTYNTSTYLVEVKVWEQFMFLFPDLLIIALYQFSFNIYNLIIYNCQTLRSRPIEILLFSTSWPWLVVPAGCDLLHELHLFSQTFLKMLHWPHVTGKSYTKGTSGT